MKIKLRIQMRDCNIPLASQNVTRKSKNLTRYLVKITQINDFNLFFNIVVKNYKLVKNKFNKIIPFQILDLSV